MMNIHMIFYMDRTETFNDPNITIKESTRHDNWYFVSIKSQYLTDLFTMDFGESGVVAEIFGWCTLRKGFTYTKNQHDNLLIIEVDII